MWARDQLSKREESHQLFPSFSVCFFPFHSSAFIQRWEQNERHRHPKKKPETTQHATRERENRSVRETDCADTGLPSSCFCLIALPSFPSSSSCSHLIPSADLSFASRKEGDILVVSKTQRPLPTTGPTTLLLLSQGQPSSREQRETHRHQESRQSSGHHHPFNLSPFHLFLSIVRRSQG